MQMAWKSELFPKTLKVKAEFDRSHRIQNTAQLLSSMIRSELNCAILAEKLETERIGTVLETIRVGIGDIKHLVQSICGYTPPYPHTRGQRPRDILLFWHRASNRSIHLISV